MFPPSSYTNPSISDFKARFSRDFPYGTAPNQVNDNDITIAMDTTAVWINPNIFGSQATYTNAFLLASANFMVLNLRSSSQGIWGQVGWPVSGKNAGSVGQSFSIPEQILNNPQYAMLTQTTYGYQFLFFVWPLLRGNVITLIARTNP